MFALIVAILVVGGVAIFLSAALGLLAREGASIGRIALTQLALGLIPGIIVLVFIRFMKPALLMKAVIPFYLFALVLTAIVFIPGLGVHAGGATRWIDVGPFTVQPAEFLKPAVILMLALFLARAKEKIQEFKHGLIPFAIILGVPVIMLALQPNNSTILVLGATSVALFFIAGAKWRDIGIIIGTGIVFVAVALLFRPYALDRVKTCLLYTSPSPRD